jgi:hypothetical protein
LEVCCTHAALPGLKLLRCGATLVATTRFPFDASVRYAAEPDYAVWQVRFCRYRFSPTGDLGYRGIRGAEGWLGYRLAVYAL